MDITIDPDWWKTLFDEVYLLTDARSVCNENITQLEVNVIRELIPIQSENNILDLCGGHGRHSLELCARGFTSCTLLDYSYCLIDRARAKAETCNYPMNFIQADARDIGLLDESFDHIFIMGNSIGYIQERDGDRQILSEAYRLLRRGGWFLVDVTDGEAVKRSFSPYAWHEIGDDLVVCRRRKLEKNAIHTREMVISKSNGLIRDRNYAVRLYSFQSLAALLEDVGFENINIRTGFSPHKCKKDYGFMNRRMLSTAQKI